MFSLPDNPYAHHPERRRTVCTRIGVVLVSIATAAVSISELYGLPPLDATREYLLFMTMVSCVVGVTPIVTELQERYRTDGGGGGGWYVPDFPEVPSPDGGLVLQTSSKNVPVSV